MHKTNRGRRIAFEFPFTDPALQVLFGNLLCQLQKHNPAMGKEVMDDVILCCEVFAFRKNHILLDYGEICRYVYFTAKGLVTAIENDNGRERHCWFMGQGDVIVSVDSFYSQTQSREKLQALDDTVCIALHIEHLQTLTAKHPAFLLTQIRLTEHYYREAYARTKWVGKSPQERYALLLEHYSRFISRLSHKALASYLGVSQRTLTRIRSAHFSK